MNISCLQENLSSALQIIRSGIGKDSGLPILSTILIRAEGKLLYLKSTNLEIAIQCNVRGKVDEEGSIAVPAKTFFDFINLLPKEKIDIKTENETTVIISCQKYHTKLFGMLPDEFPLLPPFENGKKITCNAQELKTALSAASQAASIQETRQELNGVYMAYRHQEKKIYCVGTDAYRLSEKIIAAQGDFSQDVSCIIPLRTVQELSRSILDKESPECEIHITENQILFKTETVECISKIVQGVFPDYQSIIPKNFVTKVTLEREEMVRAIKATSLFSKGDTNDVLCTFEPITDEKGHCTLSSANTGVGENMVALDAEFSGKENSITLNYRYVLEGLSHIHSEKASMSVVDTQSPCVLRPVGDETFTYLVMPIRE